LTGILSQRVLGQYDLALLDASVPPRLLLLAPNLALGARNLGVDRDELVLWVTIHELTHAVQFSGAPWLRYHLAGIVRELIDGLRLTLGGRSSPEEWADEGAQVEDHPAEPGREPRRAVAPGGENGGSARSRRPKLPDPWELREFVARAGRGELLRLT